MTEQKKQELFPVFAYLFSKQLDPEKYGNVNSIEEWTKLIQNNPSDVDAISEAASKLSEEEWAGLEKQLSEDNSEPVEEEAPAFVKNGAKLNKLKTLQKFKKVTSKPKKCSCGCDLVDKREKGGTITSECACKCNKKENGGRLKTPQEKIDIIKQAPTNVRNIYERMKALKVK